MIEALLYAWIAVAGLFGKATKPLSVLWKRIDKEHQ